METNLIVKEPDIAPIRERLSQLVSDSLSIAVISENTQKLAGEKILDIRKAIKQVEDERHGWTDPLEAQKKRLIGIFKPVLTELEFAESHLKQQLNDYFMKQKEAERKEQERLQKLAQKRFDKAQEAGKPTPFPVAIAPVVQMVEKTVQTEAGKITYISKWKARVTDSSKIPDEFWLHEINYHALDTVASDTKGTAKIPGVEFYQESYVRG